MVYFPCNGVSIHYDESGMNLDAYRYIKEILCQAERCDCESLLTGDFRELMDRSVQVQRQWEYIQKNKESEAKNGDT
ncbi:hypothetical protein [Thalassoglobus neptunius]|uniref:hypothetical protein n=1 Tax=Thalassoglobus neptunius TaxID=1938619 RepID=UPI0018D242CE|nr:hypothetical protein [Thalassoglobus neptunius]